MNGISSSQSALINAQLAGFQTRQAISTSVMSKTMDVAKSQGEAVLALIDASSVSPTSDSTPTMGAMVSGKGQNLDLSA